jgi:transcriptional regulator with XRE-family HTH domain
VGTQGEDHLGQQLQERLARNVRALRREKGLTQERLAVTTGLKVRHIQKIEAGEVNVTLRTLRTLADALQVDPADLLHAHE